MSKHNRLANSSNRFQTNAKRVLCLCSAGLLRSPTMANTLNRHFGFNTRAAGVAQEYALIPVDEVLIDWADEIVCAEQSVADQLHDFIANHVDNAIVNVPKIITLNIPDAYDWGDPRLVRQILKQYKEATNT